MWAVGRLCGVEAPWPMSPLLAFTPWVIMLCVVAVVAGAVAHNQWAMVVSAAAALVLVSAVAPRA